MRRCATTVALGAVLIPAVATVSGCSSGPEWRSGSTRLEKLDESLLAIELAWRASVNASPVKANLPDTSGCYFQVVQQHEVTDEVLCGPIRYLGDGATTWQSATVKLTRTDADRGYLTLTMAGSTAKFAADAKATPGAVPMRPDGTLADLAAELDEPPAPAAKAGDVLPWPTPMPTSAAKGRLTTPLGDHTFEVAIFRDRLGGATDRLAPPAGGSFVLVKASAPSGNVMAERSDARIVVSAAGKEHPVAPVSAGTDPVAVAVAGDGNDAKVGVSYDGLTQWIDAAKGTRSSSAAAGFYDGLGFGATGQCAELEQGRRRVKGWHRTHSCALTLTRVPYLPKPTEGSRTTVGWASEGMVFVSLDYAPSYHSTWSDGSRSPLPYESTIDLRPSLVVAGKTYAPVEARITQPADSGGGTVTAIFEVPAGQAQMTVRGTASFADTLSSAGPHAGAPTSGSGSFPVSVALTISSRG